VENLINNFLNEFTILLLAVLAGFICEKAGIINIGIEGMMTAGALIYAMIGNHFGSNNYSQIFAFLLAGGCGALIALLHGFVAITLKGDQIISGLAINMLVVALSIFTVQYYSGGIDKGYNLVSLFSFHLLNFYL
jgi:simple sugar transport system permease protein